MLSNLSSSAASQGGPARGFFEWKQEGPGKVPYFIHRPDSDFFAFAGLYDHWHDAEAGEDVASYTIITTDEEGPVKAIHHRMPVILPQKVEDERVDPSLTDPAVLVELLRPVEDLELYLVTALVNSPGNDTAEVLERAGRSGDGRAITDGSSGGGIAVGPAQSRQAAPRIPQAFAECEGAG